MSIGALSRATGVPVETLRTWERRYGFPNPDRNESGHRVYDFSSVERIRLIDRALQAGNRAANVVPLSEQDLRELLTLDESPRPQNSRVHPDIAAWLHAAKSFDGVTLEHLFRDAWMDLGPLGFLSERVGPFLFEVGLAWAEKRIAIAHEHFASERLRDFLAGHWRPLSDRAVGPIVVCATLPGEAHVLGLHMTALVCASAGMRVLNIGADAPVDAIVSAANGQRAAAVAISVSVAANRFVARQELAQMREELDDSVALIVGGLGAPRGLPNVVHAETLNVLANWAKQVS